MRQSVKFPFVPEMMPTILRISSKLSATEFNRDLAI